MKKIIVFLFFATLFLSGCSVKELENTRDNTGIFPTFYASFEGNTEADTKTYVDDEMKLRWTEDDRLSIFAGDTFNHEYKYDGETGANNGSFSAITSPEFIAAEPLEANYAVYPYNASNEMSTDGSVSVILPSVQKYAQNSFGLGANTMVAATENKGDNLLQFKNLCGYIVVKLYGEGTVTSIKLEGNDGEKISGKASVQAAYGTLPSVTMSEEATTSITLDCGEGVTLGTTAETATEFWFCVPPVTFSKGFTIKAYESYGSFSKSTTDNRTVDRNVRVSMSALEFVLDGPIVPEAVDLGLPSGIKWASCNIGASSPEEYGGYYQWAGLQDMTDTSINLDSNNCPYHTGTDYSTGWTKYIPSSKSSYWSGSGSPDNKTVLDPEDDVAHVTLGGKWRMPTEAEYLELRDNCSFEWTTLKGVNGMKFTSKKNGNSIFLPAAGRLSSQILSRVGSECYYLSSSLFSSNPYYEPSNSLSFYSSGNGTGWWGQSRGQGSSLRPVYGDRVSVTGVSLKTSLILNISETFNLGATVTPSNAAEQSVSWSSDNTSVATVNQSGQVTAVEAGSANITVRTTDGGYSATCSVTVTSDTAIPEAVDLGLSVKWASCNVGAAKPENYGGYYQWAGLQDMTDTSINLGPNNCPYHTGTSENIGWTKYVPSECSSYWSGSGSPDNKTVLDPEDDVAHIKLGGSWRMPTEAECQELLDNCTSEWTTLNEVNGMKFISKNNGNSIFLPAAGYRNGFNISSLQISGGYWYSSLFTGNPGGAYFVNFGSEFVLRVSSSRYLGFSVRPVSE